MSNTNPPPNNRNNNIPDFFGNAEQQARIERERVAASAKLNISITQATRELKASTARFVNPITRLQDSLSRLDATNRRALAAGTTTQKLTQEINKRVLSK